MNTFENFKSANQIFIILDGFKGTLYCTKDQFQQPIALIRHFDGVIDPKYIPALVDLTKTVKQWFKNHPEIKQEVIVQEFSEVGEDYLVRPFYSSQTSFSTLDQTEFKEIIPNGLYELREKVNEIIRTSDDPSCLLRVIEKSSIESAKKTYYEALSDCYFIAELSINQFDLEDWNREMEGTFQA